MPIVIDDDTHSGIICQSVDDYQDQVGSPLLNLSEIPEPSEWSPSRSTCDLHHEHEPHEVDEQRPAKKRPRLTGKSPVTLENMASTSAGPHPSSQDQFPSDAGDENLMSAALLKDLAEQGELPLMLSESDVPQASTSILNTPKNQHATPQPTTPVFEFEFDLIQIMRGQFFVQIFEKNRIVGSRAIWAPEEFA
ncbi:hypothetical protein PSTG_14263 [Puccinia striiformis f. sp. tritici PST-78]|uniref:Uncharacterized protein n=1 Tax=Puccinia striiformis f. sp. tritici PST-78 TaxID=1165861 RepID=A0A0L0UZ28_9BASI|nr:hypothetical protein PSTG_14263 [Puccinia striiformis f. sp. tritici PST-78]